MPKHVLLLLMLCSWVAASGSPSVKQTLSAPAGAVCHLCGLFSRWQGTLASCVAALQLSLGHWQQPCCCCDGSCQFTGCVSLRINAPTVVSYLQSRSTPLLNTCLDALCCLHQVSAPFVQHERGRPGRVFLSGVVIHLTVGGCSASAAVEHCC
jgi:hypothetical protein